MFLAWVVFTSYIVYSSIWNPFLKFFNEAIDEMERAGLRGHIE